MSDLLSEAIADREVIKSLLRYIKQLERELGMSKILFDAEGKLYHAHSYEEVSEETLNQQISENLKEVETVKAAIEAAKKMATPAVEAPVAEPVIEQPTTPAPEVVAAAPEQTQPDPAPITPILQ